MSWKHVLSVLMSLCLAVSAVAAPGGARRPAQVEFPTNKPYLLSRAQQQVFYDTIAFLDRMGFENYSAQAQATLDSGEADETQRRILENNRDRLAAVSIARDLAAYLYARIADRCGEPNISERLVQFTARNLNFGIKGLPDELPPEIQNIKDRKLREIEADKYLRLYIENAVNQSVSDLRADALSVIYSPEEAQALERGKDPRFAAEMKYLTEIIERLVIAKYSHLELTQTRFLGRALSLAVVRHARVNKRPEIEDRLRKVTLAHGEILDNYISARHVLTPGLSEKGENRVEPLDLKTGDLLTVYNRASEDQLQGVKLYPQGWLNQLRQFLRLQLGFQGMRSFIPWEKRITVKRLRGERLTWTETLVSFALNFPVFRRGYTAVGLVDVKTDKETGLKATWVLRNVGNEGLGGIQIEDVRNFATPGVTDRIGHSRLDGKALAQLNRKSPLGERIEFSDGEKSSFPIELSAEEREEILKSVARKGVDAEAGPRAVEAMKKMMTGSGAVGFHWGAQAGKGLLSSGQVVVAAYAQGAGLEVQSIKDSVYLSRGVSPADRKAAQGSRVVAPTSWSWDTSLAVTKTVEFPQHDPQARVMEFYGATRPPVEPRLWAASMVGAQRTQLSESSLAYVTGWARQSAEYQDLMSRSLNTERRRGKWVNVDRVEADLAATGNDGRMTEAQMRAFLFDMGFEDWVKDIEEAQRKGETYNESTRIQQERNRKTFTAMNAGRELAIYLMERMQGRLGKPEGRRQLADVVAYLMSQQPQFPVKKYPPEVLSLPENQREEAMDRYLEKILRREMEEHTRTVTADLLWHLHGDEAMEKYERGTLDAETAARIKADGIRIYDLSTTLTDRMFLDFLAGQTRYAGRAMLALLARQAELRNDDAIMKNAAAAIERVGLRMENFIGNEWVFKTPDNKSQQKVKVDTLSFVMNRLLDPMSAVIPWGAQPDLSLKARAKENGLIGNPIAALFPINADSVKDGYDMMAQLKDKASYKVLNDGYSHIGYVVMKESKGSNVRMSWVVDNYPHIINEADADVKNAKYNSGGIRFVGLEQFYLTSHHSKFLVANTDPKKFHELAMKQIAENGIPKTGEANLPLGTVTMKISPEGKPMKQTDAEAKADPWRVEQSQGVLNEFYAERNPYKFYKKYQELVVKGFHDEIRKGMIFNWITPNGRDEKGGAYCSSTEVIVSYMTAGLNPEFKPSRWISLLKVVVAAYSLAEKFGWKQFTGNPGLQDLVAMARLRIVSPSSLAAQEYVDHYTTVAAPAQEIRARLKDDWTQRVAKKPAARGALDKIVDSADRSRFAKMRFEPTELRAMAIEVHHGIEVRMGKIGLAIRSLSDLLQSAKSRAGLRYNDRGDIESDGLKTEPKQESAKERKVPQAAPRCSKVFAA